jgi:hypothetical protein
MVIANCSLRFSDNYFSSGRVVGNPSFGGYFPLARNPEIYIPQANLPSPIAPSRFQINSVADGPPN